MQVTHKLRVAEKQCHRAPHSVTLLAVSKNRSADNIRQAYSAGQTKFGENYAQEAIKKQHQLSDLAIEWHFIGTIQSNKTKPIATHFDWAHSVNKVSVAEKLNGYRQSLPTALNVCIEVNIDAEPTKSGVIPEVMFTLAEKIITLPHLKLRGLMVIPRKTHSTIAFEKTKRLFDALIQRGFLMDTLSMGMSNDFENAIAYGSTLVRIGTAIFET